MTLKSFTATIDAFTRQLEGKLDQFVQDVALEAAEAIVVGNEFSPGTPVDTGFARASWWASINSLGGAQGTVVPSAGAGAESVSAMSLVITKAKAGDIIYLLNNAAYIEMLEKGWSDQAPVGMVQVTLAAAQLIVNKVAATYK